MTHWQNVYVGQVAVLLQKLVSDLVTGSSPRGMEKKN